MKLIFLLLLQILLLIPLSSFCQIELTEETIDSNRISICYTFYEAAELADYIRSIELIAAKVPPLEERIAASLRLQGSFERKIKQKDLQIQKLKENQNEFELNQDRAIRDLSACNLNLRLEKEKNKKVKKAFLITVGGFTVALAAVIIPLAVIAGK